MTSVSEESSQMFTCECKEGEKTSPIDIDNKMRYTGIKPFAALPEDVACYAGLLDYLERPTHPGAIKSFAFV